MLPNIRAHQLATSLEELLLRSTGYATTLVEQLQSQGLQAELAEAEGIRRQLIAIRERVHNLRRHIGPARPTGTWPGRHETAKPSGQERR